MAQAQVTANQGRNAVESPDGRFLYYVKGPGIFSTLFRAPLGAGEETAVAARMQDEVSFAPSVNGVYYPRRAARLIAFGAPVHFSDAATGIGKVVAGIEPIKSLFDVSRDGRTIYFARMEKVDADLMLVEGFR